MTCQLCDSPRPRKQTSRPVRSCEFFRDGEGVLALQRAASHHTLDDFELDAPVATQAELTAATAVRCRAFERHLVRLASFICSHGRPGRVPLVAFAGKVTAIGVEGCEDVVVFRLIAVGMGISKRRRYEHLHMRSCQR